MAEPSVDVEMAAPLGQASPSESSSSDDDEPQQQGQHTASSLAAIADQQRLVAEAEARRRAAVLAVPTDGGKVRSMLRTMGEPRTLFGEREGDRRERLRRLLAQLDPARREELTSHLMEVEVLEQVGHVEKFFTEEAPELQAMRSRVMQFSAARAAARLDSARMALDTANSDDEDEGTLVLGEVKHLSNHSSQIAGKRPAQGCAISPDSSTLATAAWNGGVSLWALEDMRELSSFAAHEERCTDIAWHPEALCPNEAGEVRPPEALAFATASADGTAKCWNMAGACLHTLKGHTDRLARLAFHPAGSALATCSFDGTWRLWDSEKGACLMEQEGHSRGVYCVAFHPDGSLCASGAYDACTRVWDCRSGRNIMTFQGHAFGVLSLDFSPNGFHVATGSEDNTVRIWDLRKRGSLYVIPAHSKLVSRVKFDPASAHFLLTASYDRTAKIWSCKDWKLQTTLAGHEDKIMSADISRDGTNSVVTSSYDKTIKLWQPEVPAA